MPTSTKRKASKTSKTSKSGGALAAAKARFEQNERALKRVAKSLDAAYADLGKLSGSIGAGAGDLRKDLTRLVRDARTSLEKMSKASRKDLDRIQHDLASAAKAKPGRKPAGRAAAKPAGKAAAKKAAAKKSAAKPARKAGAKPAARKASAKPAARKKTGK